mmetsp:Transcript_58435/g.96799  ORF Transcript_58435/g.96799 Transcript_58435/m.96799 type:complete len:288 (+) Transcript_58435:45-908(+)
MSRFWKFLNNFSQPKVIPPQIDSRVLSLDYFVDEYDQSRPKYSAKIFDVLDASFKTRTKCVVDVGAGTGQLTLPLQQYLDPSTAIYAVEPLQNLREKLSENMAAFNNVAVMDATAKDLHFLEDSSVDAIFCSGSFEWCCTISTLREFERVLRGTDSYLVIVWHTLLWNDSHFLQEINQVCGHNMDRNDAIRRNIQRMVTPQNLANHDIHSLQRFQYKELYKTHEQKMSGRLFIQLIKSSLFWREAAPKEKHSVFEQIKKFILIHYGSLDAEITVPYSTMITYAKCNK